MGQNRGRPQRDSNLWASISNYAELNDFAELRISRCVPLRLVAHQMPTKLPTHRKGASRPTFKMIDRGSWSSILWMQRWGWSDYEIDRIRSSRQ